VKEKQERVSEASFEELHPGASVLVEGYPPDQATRVIIQQ
jgi:hypothetical protein